MKKLLLLSFLFITIICNAQQNKNYAYCELVGTGKMFSTKVTVQVDFGQKSNFWKGVEYLKDENGKAISFNSMVDAMNYFGKQGWEFVQAYVVSTNNQNVYHWLLKKEVSAEDMQEIIDSEEQ